MFTPSGFRFVLAVLLLAAGTAQAQLFRAYLASSGSDLNPCNLAQPCRLLPAALAAVANGGEIWMLDSANYNSGTVLIGKSVSIVAVPGALGSLVATNGGTAITISASGLRVGLRNVLIGPVAGAAAGSNGVNLTNASTLTIEKSVIANMPNGNGVYVTGSGTLRVIDTTIRHSYDCAVFVENGGRAMISTTRMLDNYCGVRAWSSIAGTKSTASVSDSVITGSYRGVDSYAGDATALARISVARTTVDQNGWGLYVFTNNQGTAELNFGSALVVDNATVWDQHGTGSVLLTLGNNQVTGNGPGIPVGTPTALAPQ